MSQINKLSNQLMLTSMLIIAFLGLIWIELGWQVQNLNKEVDSVTIYIENTDTVWMEKQGWYLSRNQHKELLPSERRALIYEFHIGYYDLIDSICRLNDIPTKLGIARSIRESRYNTTNNAVKDYNLFGIHWISSMKEFDHKTYIDKDKNGNEKLYEFVKYKSYAESIQHFCDFIKARRYVKHRTETADFEEYANSLCLGKYSIPCDPRDDINAWRFYEKLITNAEIYESDTIQ